MTALSVEGLSKRFGRTQALNNVRLTLQPGEMVALIGASGSGKSTLIRHISGLERALGESAEIRVFGRNIQTAGRLTREARDIRREVGVVFQQFNLVGRLPVITNVLIGCLGRISPLRGTLGWFSRADRLKAREALARVGMDGKARQRASTLSGGQQQRAAIARALVQGAKLLLADEPIASLDPVSSKRVMETLSALNKEDGITVLVSLHQVEYARRYCPRTVALRAGEVVFDGPSVALTNEFLRELYGDASDELILPDAALPASTPEARPYRPLRSAGGTPSLATA